MGLNTSAAYLGAANNSVNTDRKIIEILCGGVDGVATSDDFVVEPVTGAHQILVSEGRGFSLGRDVAGSQGTYFAWSDGDDTVDLPVPGSNPFYATLVLRIADSQYGTVPSTEGAYWEVLSGTEAASPTPLTDTEIDATAVPGTWLRIADILINTGDTGEIPSGQISDERVVVGTVATIAARVLATESGVSANAAAITALQGTVAALDIPDIRVQQTEPTTDLVAGKTVWINY